MSDSPFDFIDGTCALLAEARQEAEGDVIVAVLAKWPAHVPVAELAGLDGLHFASEDFRILWTVASHARLEPLPTALRHARQMLKLAHLWCDAEPARCWRQGRHSDATLAGMAMEYPYCEGDARNRVLKLRRIVSHAERFAEIVMGAERYAQDLRNWIERNVPAALEPPEYFGEFVLRVIEEWEATRAAPRQEGAAA